MMTRWNDSETAPKRVMKFCPRCGSGEFAAERDDCFRCAACGFRFFVNAAAAVMALLTDPDGKLLFTRREKDPGAGLLDFPGGFVDPGETAEDALGRELVEELGLELEEAPRFLFTLPNTYPYGGLTYVTLDLVFHIKLTSRQAASIEARDEISGLLWSPPGNIQPEQIAFLSAREALRRFAFAGRSD